MTAARSRHVAAFLVLAAAVSLVTANSWSNAFIADDVRLIAENGWLDQGSAASAFTRDYYQVPEDSVRLGYYRPITLLSNLADFRLWGRDPRGFHLTNALAHLAASLLVYALALRLVVRPAAALLAALAFATTPVHAESVTFISGRVDVLATVLGLAAILAVLARRPSAAAALWLGALLAKEIAVVVPALALLCLIVARPARGRGRELAGLAARSLLVLALYVPARLYATGTLAPRAEPGPVPQALARAANVHAFYWSKLLLPAPGFDVEPPLPGGESFGAGRLLLALAPPALGLWLLARRREGSGGVAGLGMLWVSIALLPVSQLVRLETAVSPRYLYLASAGWAMTLAALVASRPRAGALLVGALALVQAPLLLRHNRYYADSVTFYRARKELDPGSLPVRVSLAGGLAHAGDLAGSLAELREAADRFPGDGQLQRLLGETAARAGRLDEASQALWVAARAAPLSARLAVELGEVELLRGEPERARSAFRRARLAAPADPAGAVGLARAAVRTAEEGGDACAALQAVAQARAIAPRHPALDALAPAIAGIAGRCPREDAGAGAAKER